MYFLFFIYKAKVTKKKAREVLGMNLNHGMCSSFLALKQSSFTSNSEKVFSMIWYYSVGLAHLFEIKPRNIVLEFCH